MATQAGGCVLDIEDEVDKYAPSSGTYTFPQGDAANRQCAKLKVNWGSMVEKILRAGRCDANLPNWARRVTLRDLRRDGKGNNGAHPDIGQIAAAVTAGDDDQVVECLVLAFRAALRTGLPAAQTAAIEGGKGEVRSARSIACGHWSIPTQLNEAKVRIQVKATRKVEVSAQSPCQSAR